MRVFKNVYTAYIFEGIDPDALHCTHKFLGTQSLQNLAAIENVVVRFFDAGRKGPRLFPKVFFDTVHQFGPEKNIRVLTPSAWVAEDWFPDLRQALAPWRGDDYARWVPHVTTPDLLTVEPPFSGFALIAEKQVIRAWPAL